MQACGISYISIYDNVEKKIVKIIMRFWITYVHSLAFISAAWKEIMFTVSSL